MATKTKNIEGIYIFRKTDSKSPKLTATQLKQAEAILKYKVRVKRPGILDLFLKGEFNKLPMVPQPILDSWHKYENLDKGYRVNSEDMGKAQEASYSQAESIRLWVANNLGPLGVDPNSFGVIYIPPDAE